LKNGQTTLHNFVKVGREYPGFGDFDSPEGYGGFAPSEQYLSHMMNRVIESDELDANQHTSCLAPDQLAIDDSHKVCTFHLRFIIKLFSNNLKIIRSANILPKLKVSLSVVPCGPV